MGAVKNLIRLHCVAGSSESWLVTFAKVPYSYEMVQMCAYIGQEEKENSVFFILSISLNICFGHSKEPSH